MHSSLLADNSYQASVNKFVNIYRMKMVLQIKGVGVEIPTESSLAGCSTSFAGADYRSSSDSVDLWVCSSAAFVPGATKADRR